MRSAALSSSRSKLSWAIAATLTTGLASSLAQAQSEGLEEIQVTGSRILNQTTLVTPTPVTAVTTDELVNINPGTTMAEQLDKLPQFFSTQSAQRGGTTFTTASGSYLNLRGMGTQRTLVLLDGSRITPADAGGATNIDNFPTALMRRVDVITGGASAAYGADALAGVVNFVLDREFEGLKTRVSTGINEYGDGDNYAFSVAGGKAFMDDRLHLIGSIEARYVDQIDGKLDRHDNYKHWGLVQNPDWSPTAGPGVPRRITVPYVFDNRGAPTGMITTPNFKYTNYVFTDDGQGVRPYRFGQYSNSFTNSQSGGPEFRNHEAAFMFGASGNEVVQRSFFTGIKYDVSDALSLRAQVIAGRTEGNSYGRRTQPSLPGISYASTLFIENPYLPADVVQAMQEAGIDRITVEKRGQIRGPGLTYAYDDRTNQDISQMKSFTAGFDWDIDDNWHMTANYQVGRSKVHTGTNGIPRVDKYYLSMDAVRDDNGNIVCKIAQVNPTPEQLKEFMEGKLLPSPLTPLGVPADSPLGPLNPLDCVPHNMIGLGLVTQEALDFINDPEKKSIRKMDQDFAEILVSGQLFEGWGAGPITSAFGLTYRDEYVSQWSYPSTGERGLLNAPHLGIRGIPIAFSGPGSRSMHAFTGPAVGIGYNTVKEAYGELNVPIWNWDSGQSITTNLGFRRSDYESSGSIDSWKIGLDVTLHEDLRWRYTKSRDVREPNLSERFFTGVGGGVINDPAFGGAVNSSLTVLPSPNPNLQTEQGDTITTGFIYSPSFAEWIDGLSIAVDWYEIDLAKSIGLYGAQALVDDCYYKQVACDLVRRDPTTNIVQQILNIQTNSGGAQTRGVDVEIQYNMEPNFFSNRAERLNFRGMIGYMAERSTTSAGGIYIDYVKRLNNPEYTGLFTLNYDVENYGVMLQTVYIDSVLSNGGSSTTTTNWIEGVDIDDNTVASQTVFNLGLSYNGELQSGATWRLALNVNNLLDREPPVIAGASGQVINYSYDVWGRRYQLSLNVNF